MEKNFAKLAIQNGGAINKLLLPSRETKGSGICNPSILVSENKILVNLRVVDYSLYHSENNQLFPSHWGPLSYIHPENYQKLKTTNYIVVLDKNLNQKSLKKVDTSKLDQDPAWEFVGLEDARLVEWNNELILVGVRRDVKENGEGRMEMSFLDKDFKETKRLRIEPPIYSYCEKNWMPIQDTCYNFVKWSNPTEVVEMDKFPKKNSLKSKTKILKKQNLNHLKNKLNRDVRGSSQVINFGNFYLALTHEVDLYTNEIGQKDAQYYHRFIVWGSDFKIIKYSNEFKFLSAQIEFSCGMAIHENNLLITFSIQDSTSFILSCPISFIANFIDGNCEDSDTFIVNKTSHTLNDLVRNPNDPENNYSLGLIYESQGHLSSAITFYLKSAEFTEDKIITYSSLVRIGLCYRKLGDRFTSEVNSYMHAIALDPFRSEAYLFISQCYESVSDWQKCYLFARLGKDLERQTKKYKINEFEGNYSLIFQMALSAWCMGKTEEGRRLFFNLSNHYNNVMSEKYMELVQGNITCIGSGKDPFVFYDISKFDRLKFKFDDIVIIKNNYSQTYQDMFVLSVLNGKKKGTYLEIGAGHFDRGNNTYLLENVFNWGGVSIETNKELSDSFNLNRNNVCINKNALEIDYSSLLRSNFKVNDIDYLQIDCEPPSVSFEILKRIPFDKFRFAVITFEHDYYADITKSYRDLSREYLKEKGYNLVVSNVSPNDFAIYEDWWVHPDLTDVEIIKKMISIKEVNKVEDYFLNK
jgi:tetratricopeptide (TPR) repeat protein